MAGRSEARVHVTIWNDPDFRALTANAQRMYLFLMSQGDLAHDGVIALRERRWSGTAADLTIEDVLSALKELEESRFVIIDRDTEELLIRSLIRRDKVCKQPYVLKAAFEHMRERVTSPTVLAAVEEELRRIKRLGGLPNSAAQTVEEMLAFIAERRPEGAEVLAPESPESPSVDPSLEGLDIPSEQEPQTSATPPHELSDADTREDVTRVCLHLADWVERNGSKRPSVTARWRQAARLMLDTDGRTVDQVLAAIDWCQQDEFWRANILSMPKLRAQYDRLRLAAKRKQPQSSTSSAYRNPTDQDAYEWRPPA